MIRRASELKRNTLILAIHTSISTKTTIRKTRPTEAGKHDTYSKGLPMTFDEFVMLAHWLGDEESLRWRNWYIGRFVDESSEQYVRRISKYQGDPGKFSRAGYLWDCLRDLTSVPLIGWDDIADKVKSLKQILICWDFRSVEHLDRDIREKWPFGHFGVLQVDSETLLRGIDFLPEDLYLFDRTLSWTLILTHEYFDGNDKRLCYQIGL
jgi:hypothetical protein